MSRPKAARWTPSAPKFIRDVLPGEIVIFDENGVRSIEDHVGKTPMSACVFEYIYFARPDSVIDGASVHSARLRAARYPRWSIRCRPTL